MQVRVQTDAKPIEQRWRVRRSVNIDLLPAAGGQVATVRNLSENGLLLESTTPLPVGSTISLTFPEASVCTAEVVWQNGYLYGCRFHYPLSRSAVSAAVLRSPFRDRDGYDELLTNHHQRLDDNPAQRPVSNTLSIIVLLILAAMTGLFVFSLLKLAI